STAGPIQVTQAEADDIIRRATTKLPQYGPNAPRGPGQDQDFEMAGVSHPVETPTLEELVAHLNVHLEKGNTSLNPGSYLPSFKKGVVTEQIAADILNKFVTKAAILLDKSRMAEKILRELLAHTQAGYWGHAVVNANRVTLSKDASQTLKTKFEELLIQTIRDDK
ncbi:hypothetical protein BGZ81_005277, partial [Podila clonocystis]